MPEDSSTPSVPTVKLPLDVLRAMEIALHHDRNCACENCTTARFWTATKMSEFRA